MLIGLSGKKRVGKDTVGHWLEVKHEFTRISFAALLKKQAKRVGWSGHKDEKGRRLLQELGMVVRNYDEDFWVDATFRELTKINRKTGQDRFVITDVRFKNEARRIKEAGGVMIRITRPDEITNDPHASETDLDDYEFDHVIESVLGDLNSLYSRVDEIVVQESVRVSEVTK